MKKLSLVILMLLVLSACGVSKDEHQVVLDKNVELQNRVEELGKSNSELTLELEELKFGASKILEEIKISFDGKDYVKTKELAVTLSEKHPTAPEVTEANKVLASIKKIEEDAQKAKDLAEKQKKEELAKAAEAEKQRLATAVSKMRIKYDEMTDITWYTDKTTTEYVDTNAFYAYIGVVGDTPTLRLKIQYQGDDWLFIDSYIIKVGDETHTISPSYGQVERDNGYGGVLEWYDVAADKDTIAMLRDIASSKKTTVRHSGDTTYYDRVLQMSEKDAIQNVLNAFDALSGGTDI